MTQYAHAQAVVPKPIFCPSDLHKETIVNWRLILLSCPKDMVPKAPVC